jgi:hypothetical protein
MPVKIVGKGPPLAMPGNGASVGDIDGLRQAWSTRRVRSFIRDRGRRNGRRGHSCH